LCLTVVGSPVAVAVLVLAGVTTPALVIERCTAPAALRRSRDLVRPWLVRTLVLTAALSLVLLGVAPLLGVLVLLAWSPALSVVNVVAALVYAVTVPCFGIALALLFYDLRARHDVDLHVDVDVEP